MPAIVGIVFQARLQALLHNLKNGKYFGGDKTVYIIHVIEYQERGFPHAHIVCKLERAGRDIEANFKRMTEEYEMIPADERMGLQHEAERASIISAKQVP